MKKVSTSERLHYLMSTRGLKQIDILEKIKPYAAKYGVKFGKSSLSQYVKGTFEPGSEKLSILGLALNVSEVWLMGYDVPMERNKNLAAGEGDEDAVLFSLIKLLSNEEKDIIIASIKGILANRK